MQQPQFLIRRAVVFQFYQTMFNGLHGLFFLLIFRQHVRVLFDHVQPRQIRKRPDIDFNFFCQLIKNLSLFYRLPLNIIGV
ncbi:hypothetical protein D3C78_830310 [compost metagenome]